jgi:antitoxin (DNA-binding transcriptional repressor) of toxin-antitoxin stability system
MTMMMTTKEPLKVSIAYAKAHLSELIREAERRPVFIQNRGRTVASVTAQDEESTSVRKGPLDGFLAKIEIVRKRHRIRGVSFQPKKMKWTNARAPDFGD